MIGLAVMTYMFSVKFHSLCDAHAYAARERCKVFNTQQACNVTLPTPVDSHLLKCTIYTVYWYFHCDFQQNIALFCVLSEFVLLLLFAVASCLIQWRYRKLFFFAGRDTGREVTVEIVVEV